MDWGEILFKKALKSNFNRVRKWYIESVNKIIKNTKTPADPVKRSEKQMAKIRELKMPKLLNEKSTEEMLVVYKRVGIRSGLFMEEQIGQDVLKLDQEWDLMFEESMEIQKQRYFESAGITNKSLLDAGQKNIELGISEGMTVEDQMSKLKTTFPDYPDWRLEVIVRTNSSEATNWGRMSVINSNPLITGWQYNAILDKRTTDICNSLSGQYFKKGDPAGNSVFSPSKNPGWHQ